MSLTERGISTTIKNDCFRHENFRPAWHRKTMVQWDYRDSLGELHTGVAKDLDAAKSAAKRFGYSE
jgi:hypothetical protein